MRRPPLWPLLLLGCAAPGPPPPRPAVAAAPAPEAVEREPARGDWGDDRGDEPAPAGAPAPVGDAPAFDPDEERGDRGMDWGPPPGVAPEPAPPAAAGPGEALVVVSDGAWRARNRAAPWATRPDVDEEGPGWFPARALPGPEPWGACYAADNMLGVPSAARWIWCDEGCPDGVVRRALELPAGFTRAEALLVCDDRAELFVNGELVAAYDTNAGAWGHRGGAVVVDLRPWLVEGRNVVAATVLNRMGPGGLALDLRVDGPPLVPPLALTFSPARLAELAAFDQWARRLARPGERAHAVEGLGRLVARHGHAFADRIDALLRAPDPDVRLVAGGLRALLEPRVPDLSPRPGRGGPQFSYPRLRPDEAEAEVVALWTRGPTEQVVTVRNLLALHVLALDRPAAVIEAARRTLARHAQDDVVVARVVASARALGLRGLAPELAALLEAKAGTRLGAAAASALGPCGEPGDVAALEAAARSSHGPTARAAGRALRELRSR